MASSGVMYMDTEYSEAQDPVSPTLKGRKDKGKDIERTAYELPEFSLVQKQLIGMLNSSGPMKQLPATATMVNAVDDNFSTEGLTIMALVFVQGYQIKNLTVMLQNLSTSFQEHLARIKRETRGEAEPRPVARKPSNEKTKLYMKAVARKDPETPPKKKKKNESKCKAEEGPTLLKAPNTKQAKGNHNGEVIDKAEWKKVEGQKPQNTMNVAKRKFFTIRVMLKQLTNATADEAKILVALSKTLTGYMAKRQYWYFDKNTDMVNEFMTAGEPAFLLFRRVMTDINILINGILLEAIPTDHAELDTKIKQYFKESYKINQTSAKFFKADPKSQEGK
ncbi:hypothetical protein HOY80DRAFT_1054642 [Tuber brumale]|nr:hypothetical protein HOY80DRAFT_1054642 [Tuber brumale]